MDNMNTTSNTQDFRAMEIAELEETNGGLFATTLGQLIKTILKPGTAWV